jgi:hypothetical protein
MCNGDSYDMSSYVLIINGTVLNCISLKNQLMISDTFLVDEFDIRVIYLFLDDQDMAKACMGFNRNMQQRWYLL